MNLDRRHLLLAATAGALSSTRVAYGQPRVGPEAVGFSARKLAALDAGMQAFIDRGQLAGVTTLVARHGKVVHLAAQGYADVVAQTPLAENAIFRIASMTKCVVGVAMMMFYEAGKWRLDDTVETHIPQFKGLKVRAVDGFIDAQVRPMTMRQLVSHSAGFDGARGSTLQAPAVETPLPSRGAERMIERLAQQPLAFQPGTDWRYGPGASIQGYLIEKWSGMTLDQFFRARIFAPLQMKDTGYYVPAAKAARVVKMHAFGPDGRLGLADFKDDSVRVPAAYSGSSGLLSTAQDFWRFAQMLANGGELDGVRLLAPASTRLMRQNLLPPEVKVDLYGPSQEGVGFGIDFAVMFDPGASRSPMGKGSHWWGGGYGTWFWIDPTHDVVAVTLIQCLRGSIPNAGAPPLRDVLPRLVYGALENPRA